MAESPYWLGFSASSWGTSWGGDVTVEEHPERYGGGSGLGRRRGGPWQDMDSLLKIRQRDTEDDVLLLMLH
jgi:hypothetical protein